jgi:hypothetical protein
VGKQSNGWVRTCPSYPLWQANFNADDRGDGNPFAYGPASRHFKVYPRVGDAIFDTETQVDENANNIYDLTVGARTEELFLDPANTDGTAIASAEVYVDSTSVAAFVNGNLSFADREFALVTNGTANLIVKMVTGSDPSSAIRFNYLNDEEFYRISVSASGGAATPQYGDIIYHYDVVGGAQHAWLGLVLKYDSGLVTYQRLSTDEFSSGQSISFLYRAGPGIDYSTRSGTFSTASSPSAFGGGTTWPSGSRTITGYQTGAWRDTVGSPSNQGDDALNSGTLTSPVRTLYGGMAKARLAFATPQSAGCTLFLKSGDHAIGPGGATDLGGSGTGSNHWTHLIGVTSGNTRIVAYSADVGTNFTIDLRRIHFKSVTIWESQLTYLINRNSDSFRAVLWYDECTLSSASPISGGEFSRTGIFPNVGPYPAVFFTSCRAATSGRGMVTATLVRDCEAFDVGGDCFSQTAAVINADLDQCRVTGNQALHGDVGQYEAAIRFQNIIWQNIRAKRLAQHQIAPNVAASKFIGVAFVDMVQVITDADTPQGITADQIENLIVWNCTFAGARFGFGGGLIESVSIESCYFERFVVGGDLIPRMAWFRNNHHQLLTDGASAPGENVSGMQVSTGGDEDDLFAEHVDPTQTDYYAPNSSGPLVDSFNSLDIKVGTDTYGASYTTPDKGGTAN